MSSIRRAPSVTTSLAALTLSGLGLASAWVLFKAAEGLNWITAQLRVRGF